ncbi:MAG: glycosyltransferase [Ignavibacteria bacterium]|jgi:glycosyltransferase involved in cell wall biosynthesis|nr:glycosyltransferase [Ignavibacteria bacterium]
MKIAFLSSFYPYPGEIAEGNSLLYRTLEKANEIQAFNFSLLYPELLFPGKEQNVSSREVVDMVPNTRILNTANPASYYFTASTINSTKPDIMLSRLWMPYLAASIGGVGKCIKKDIKRIAIVDSIHNGQPIVFEESAAKLFAKNYDAFIVLNGQAKDDLLIANPNAVYAEHPRPFFSASADVIDKKVARKILNIPTDKNILLFFGDVRKYRGIDVTLQTLSMLDDNYHLLIAGQSASGFDYYNRKINDLGIKDRTTIISHKLNTNEIPYIFYASDVLLMPFEEDVSNSIVGSAFSYQLPVIVTDVGSFKEIFEEKNFGIIIDKTDADLLLNAIHKYYNEGLEKKFKQNLNGLRYGHSWESLATIIFDVYESLLDKEDKTIYY